MPCLLPSGGERLLSIRSRSQKLLVEIALSPAKAQHFCISLLPVKTILHFFTPGNIQNNSDITGAEVLEPGLIANTDLKIAFRFLKTNAQRD